MLIKTIKPVLPVQTYRQKLRTGNTSRAARALAEVRLSPAFARRVTAEIESSYPRLALILQEIDLKKEMYWRCAQSTANPLSATYSLLPRSFYQSWGWDRSMPPKIHWLGEGTVTLPSSLTKNGRSHTFPVVDLTVQLLRHVPFRTVPNRARGKTSLDAKSGVQDWTIHDLRRTFASGLAALGVSLPVIERLLNHVSGSFAGIVGVYQRYDFQKEMRQGVELWEKHIQTLLAPEVKPRGSRASQKWETRDAALIEEASA